MKTHTSNFKNEIKLLGKEIDSKITFGSTVLGKDDLNSVTPSFQGSILKSVMKELDIDSNVDIPLNTVLKYEFGVKVNGAYEYINFGNYVVYKSEKQEDTNSYRITCYDKMLYSMKEYEKMNITYPITLRNYINAVCSHLGLTFKDMNGTFANYNRTIQNELYIDKDGNSLGYTFRDVFDELAQATASTICINNNDELEIRYINDTGDTIDEEFLRDVNVNFGEKFGAVNTIVLSRSAESDNIYYPETLPTNPYELKIVDNQIMNGNDRADYLPDIYNKLNGLEFYINDFSSTGICYYDLCDRYNVKVGDKTYSCVMFNDEILVTQGLRENVFTDMPKETKTDYTKADKTDRRINQTNLIVDKQNQEIQALVESVKDIEVDTTLTKQASGNPITIEDAGAYPCENFIVEGKSEQETRSGKNKLNLENLTSRSVNGTTLTKNNDGSFTLNGTTTNSLGFNIAVNTHDTLKANTTYTIKVITTGTATSTSNSIIAIREEENTNLANANFSGASRTYTPTTDTNINYIRIYIDTGVTFTNFTVYPLLYEGTENEEYEQYGISPSPDYPSEIETVKGIENLFDIETTPFIKNIAYDSSGVIKTWSNFSGTKNHTKVSPNTTYTFNVDVTFSAFYIVEYDENKTFIVRQAIENKKTFKTSSTTEYILISINNETIATQVQLEEGTVAHPIVPYGSRYLINKITGKNIFDLEVENIGYYVSPTTGILVANELWNTSDFIEVEPNIDYTLSGKPISYSQFAIIEYDSNKTFIQRNASPSTESTTFTIITTSTTKYVRIAYRNDRVTSEIQLEKSSIATNFEPYKENIITYDLKGNELVSIGDIKDELDEVSGVLTKRIGKVVLNGSESNVWTVNETTYGYQFDIANLLGAIGDNSKKTLLSNKFKASTFNDRNNGDTNIIYGYSNDSRIRIKTDVATTVEEWKTWLSNNPVTVYYVLAEEETIQLEPTEIELFKGTNNIYTLEDLEPNMNITYLTNSKLNSQYATKSELKVAENSIKASVSGEITELDKKTEASLELKVDRNDNDQIVSMINASAEEMNLKANRFSMESDKSKIDKDGTVKFEGGTIGGFEITKDKLSTTVSQTYGPFNDNDLQIVQQVTLGQIAVTQELLDKYDIDGNGILDISDLLSIQRIILGTDSGQHSGNISINSNNYSHSLETTSNGVLHNKIGIEGAYFKKLGANRINLVNDETGEAQIRIENRTNNKTCVIKATTDIREMDSGLCTLNSTNIVTVNFNKTFETAPNVVITPYTTTTGVIAPKINEITNTGFKATIGGSGISNVQCCWIAIS